MARAPRLTPALDTLAPIALRDPYPAEGQLLRTVDQRQHALATAWGWPPTWRSVDWSVGINATATFVLPFRVPPGVTALDIAIQCVGIASFKVTSSIDAIGSELDVDTFDDVQLIRSAGPAPAGSKGPRAITVRTPAGWAPIDELISFAVSTNLFGLVAISGVGFRPVQVAR